MRFQNFPEGALLSLSGDSDLYWFQEHNEELDRICSALSGVVRLDLERVTFMDCIGIGVLQRLRIMCKQNDAQLYLLSPRRPVMRILRLAHLDATMPFAETPSEYRSMYEKLTETTKDGAIACPAQTPTQTAV
jgi:anti-anti-sigma factor